jgi:F0F1-type ATP synthase membrane subunit b/b'
LTAQSRELEAAFQRKARSLNLDIKDIYDRARNEAVREQDKIATQARDKAKAYLDSARAELKDNTNRAREALIKEAPVVGQAITDRLLAKDVI